MRVISFMQHRFETVLLVVLGALAAESSAIAPTSVQEAVDDVLLQVGSYRMTSAEAETRLRQFPDGTVISALVTALNVTPGLKSEGRRSFAYRALRERGAVDTEIGFQQFLVGLHDPAATEICVEVLLDAAQEKQDKVREHIEQYIRSTRQRERHPVAGPYVDRVLGAIRRKGSDAAFYANAVKSALCDPLQHKDVRTAAAWTILRIKGLGEGLKYLGDLDAVAMEAAMGGLAEETGELLSEFSMAGRTSSGFYEQYREDIAAARALVLRALQSPRPETQAAALETMGAVYGNDIMIVRSVDDYQLNPELEPALERIVEKHPDEGLRQRVAGWFDPASQHRMAQRILEIRQQEAKSQDE